MNLRKRTLPIAMMTLALIPAGIAGAEPMVDRGNLEAVAKAAKTPADHAKVAKQYRLRAEEWKTKAEKHEADVKRLKARHKSAMEYKWPAMANNQSLEKARQMAVEARRAALESNELAEYHYRASIESQFVDAPAEP
jgi:hypothetical protein